MINIALKEGIVFFDLADIYGGGKAEDVFAKAVGMNSSVNIIYFNLNQ